MPITRKTRIKIKRVIALFMLFTILNQIFAPSAFALTAGPTAPEATNFEPIDTTDMVNPLTGSFTYNLPLLEVPGPEGSYPLALSYHAGIQPNEEASWVGLGWSLNPGAISRNVNGYADDWSGVTGTERDFWNGGSTETVTISLNIGITGSPASVGFGLSFSQDTYRGFGVGWNAGPGLDGYFNNLHQLVKLPVKFGIGFGVNAGGGDGIGFNVSSTQGFTALEANKLSADIGIATNFRSTTGYARATFAAVGASISTSSIKPTLSLGFGSITAVNNPNGSKVSTSSSSFAIPVPLGGPFSLSLGYNYTRYWTDETTGFTANGVLNSRTGISYITDLNTSGDDNYQLLDPIHHNIIDNSDPLMVIGGTYPNFDNYCVSGQGIGGNIRPYIFSAVLYNQNRINNTGHGNDSYAQDLSSTGVYRTKWKFRFINDFSNSYTQSSPWNSDQSYSFDANPKYGNNDGSYGYDATTNRLEGTSHIEYFTNDEILDPSSTSKAHQMGFIDCDAAGFTRPSGSQIGGFMITNSSGVTYHYALPAYSSNELVHTELINRTNGYHYNDLHKNTPYAYTWYLTAITGPDYVSRGNKQGVLDKGDWGYWVKFDYGKWTGSYGWRNPSEGFHRDLDNAFQDYSSGTKDLYYLNAIETRSHTALFVKSLRTDAKSSVSNGFDNTSVSSLALRYILLMKNDQFTSTLTSIRSTGNLTSTGSDFTNVIDDNDITQLSEQLSSKCLRKISFNYDNSLCPGVVNSFPASSSSNTTNLGKLTLLSLDFQGRGGTSVSPPMQFQYDLDPTDPANQAVVSLGTPTGQTGTLQTQTANQFKVGDILLLTLNNVQYYCTLLSTTDNLNYNIVYLKNAPSSPYTNAAAVRTKNPPYNKEAYDNWGCYKSDYIASPSGNENLSRFTTPVSNKSTDAWCLRTIKTGIGSNININYEGNTYNKSVLNNNRALVINTPITSNGGHSYTFPIINEGLDLSKIYKPGDKLSIILLKYIYSDLFPNVVIQNPFKVINSDSYRTAATIQNLTNNSVTVTINAEMDNDMTTTAGFPYYTTSGGSGTTPANSSTMHIILAGGNIIANGASFFYGGGIRVKDVAVDDLIGQMKKTSYDYSAFGNPKGSVSSSGITSYEPLVFDIVQFTTYYAYDANRQLTSPSYEPYTMFKRELYKDFDKLLAISHELPGPGVMYETVAVADSTILPNGSVIPVEGKTVYQYAVFKPEMIGIDEYSYNGPIDIGGATKDVGGGGSYRIASQFRRNMAIKDYTSRIGNLKRVITYDNLGNKITEKVNHYLNDDLDNTSFQNQVTNYEPRLLSYNGIIYNNIGVIQERYGTARVVVDPAHISSNPSYSWYDDLLVMSNKETFPAIQTGTTQIDYKNGTRIDQSNLAYDFYSGAVTKTLLTDSYGNRFVTQIIQAYMAGGISSLAYPALGLRTHDDISGATQHKQMLSQQAANYTFSVDVNNNPIGVVAATVQTWGNSTPTLDPIGTTITESNIWRMNSNYNWMPSGSSATNLAPYSEFVDYFAPGGQYINPGASNPSWKKTAQVTKYNVYSVALEATDINNNYAATRMGYDNSKVLITGGPANYNEIAYAGAEDVLLSSGYFSSNISPGSGTVVTDTTKSHTGTKSLMVAAGQNGFTYTLASPASKNYSVAVWVKPTASNAGQAQLYYQIGTGTVVTPTQTLAKTAAGWYLLEITVPSTAINGTNNLTVGCKNASSAALYFDDFRFQPISAVTTAYVYDNQTGELTYILGNNNLYVRYQYDVIGRLVRTYKEVLGKSVAPLAKSFVYNYAHHSTTGGGNVTYLSAAQSVPFTKSCSAGSTGTIVNYTLSQGAYTSTVSQTDADDQANVDVAANGQNYANANGSCLLNITIGVSNTTTDAYEINLSGSGTTSYTYNFSSHTIQVPADTYEVIIYPTSSSYNNLHTFKLTGQPDQTGVPRASFNSVNVSAGSNITISVQ